MQIICIGEILWDVFEEKEFLGGAPLNFSATAQRLGNHVALLTGVGKDERGNRALQGMESLGLGTEFVQPMPDLATGTAIVVMDDKGNASYAIPRPAAFDGLQMDDLLLKRLADLRPHWIYFGTLAQTHSGNESIVQELLQHTVDAKCFYDMNLRTGHWNLALVERLSGMATILKLNESEAEVLFQLTASADEFSLERFCELWSTRHGIQTIVITLGGEGLCHILRRHDADLPGNSCPCRRYGGSRRLVRGRVSSRLSERLAYLERGALCQRRRSDCSESGRSHAGLDLSGVSRPGKSPVRRDDGTRRIKVATLR